MWPETNWPRSMRCFSFAKFTLAWHCKQCDHLVKDQSVDRSEAIEFEADMIVGEHVLLMHEEYEEHEPEIGKDHEESFQLVVEIGFRGLFKPLGQAFLLRTLGAQAWAKTPKVGGWLICVNGSQYLPKHSDGQWAVLFGDAIACQAL